MVFKQKINNIRKSKDGKVLIENFLSLSFLQVAGYVFPLITLPYLTRVIGVDKFGEIAFASAIIVWFQTVSDWGFNFTATRDIAKNRDDKEKVSEIFSNVMCARILLMLLSFVVLILLIIIIPKFNEMYVLLLVTFGLVFGHIMFPEWLFQGLEKMKYITILTVLAKLLFTIAVFVFIKEKSDYILQPLFTTLGFIVSGIIAMYFIIVRFRIRFYKPSFRSIKITIKNSNDVFINTLMPNLYNNFSMLLLGFLGGATSNGIYDAGKKLIPAFTNIITVISRTFYPFLARRMDKHNVFAKLILSLSFLISLSLFIFAPFVIDTLYSSEFSNAVMVSRITAFSVFFLTLSKVYGTNYLIINGFDKQCRKITTIVSIIGFFISFPLIYFFNYIGASVVFMITSTMLGTGLMLQSKKIKHQKKHNYNDKVFI